jgi:hypothetical protein
MELLIETEITLPLEVSPTSDRRRHDRIEALAPALLPLLRGPLPDPEAYDRANDMRPMEGIAVSVLLSALPWAIIGGVIHLLTR